VLKLHMGVGWREILKNLLALRWPVLGAGNEFAALARLNGAGVPTMTVAAFAEVGSDPARRRSFVLLDDIAHDETLEDVARAWRTTPASIRERRALISGVARIARGMHAAGVNHRDFYLCHFLCARAGGLWLIDLHRAGVRAQVPARWREKDLAQLLFSALDAQLTRHDRLHFLRTYHGGSLPRDARTWAMWQRIEEQAQWLHRKGRRLGIVD
jgi:heptose I phosphotransferase